MVSVKECRNNTNNEKSLKTTQNKSNIETTPNLFF